MPTGEPGLHPEWGSPFISADHGIPTALQWKLGKLDPGKVAGASTLVSLELIVNNLQGFYMFGSEYPIFRQFIAHICTPEGAVMFRGWRGLFEAG